MFIKLLNDSMMLLYSISGFISGDFLKLIFVENF